MNKEPISIKIIPIKAVSMNVNGVAYTLENTSFPERFITHEMIVEMFYAHRGYKVEAYNSMNTDKAIEDSRK